MEVPFPGCRRLRSAYLFLLLAFIAGAYGVCSPPQPPNNTSYNADPTKVSYEIGSTVTYVCNETKGYVQSPGKSSTITCQDDSTWSEIEEFCERSCKLPLRFQYGELQETFINRNVFPVGTNVTYKCRPGYVLIRGLPKTITCLDTLQWTEIKEFCERRDCGNPGELFNGHAEFQTGEDGQIDTKFGSSVTFVCNIGYRLVGRKTRTCKPQGWDNAVPRCETIICQKPPDISNGTHSSMGQEEFQYQSGVTYTCNSNIFSLIGEASIYCTEDADWSGPAPKCKVISCTSPHVRNADRISGFGASHTFKDTIEFACKAGFIMNGSSLIQCGEDNEWHPRVPVCQFVTCGSPPEIADGTHNGTDPYAYGTTVTYHCSSKEFMLSGKPSIHCGIDGSWSEQAPTCGVVTCQTPPEISNGNHDGTGPFAYGTSVTYRCNSENFMLTGESSIHCGIDGSWSGPPPTCRALNIFFNCEIKSIPHGEMIIVPENNSVFEIRCVTLYVLHGEKRIKCIGENQWNTPFGECHLSFAFVAGIIILCLIVVVCIAVYCYCNNKKKQGHYPTNEKGGSKVESMQLKNSDHTVDA